jgi:hypothetical protein
MIKSIKRLVLTGAAVMVMMSFAVPAMAADLGSLESNYATLSDPYTDIYLDSLNPVVVGPAPTEYPPCYVPVSNPDGSTTWVDDCIR